MKTALEVMALCKELEDNPFAIKEIFWPQVTFYREQKDIIESVWFNDETFVAAANMMGKDYVAGYISLAYFLAPMKIGKTCRIVTTSVKDDHLRVLWGEISRFIGTSRYPLSSNKGGPLIVNHRDIRRAVDGKGGYNYLTGMVADPIEGLSGHHAEWALAIVDEASGIRDEVYSQLKRWAKRLFVFGNPNPTVNFFYKSMKAGDLLDAPLDVIKPDVVVG